MNGILKRFITVLLSVLLLVYVGYQAYLALYHPVRTQRADSTTVEDAAETKGFAIRDETPILYHGTGVLDYVRQDGERVSNGGTVANIYSNAQEAENERKLQLIGDKISQLEDVGTYDEANAVDVNVLNAAINEKFLNLADESGKSNINGMDDTTAQLLELFNEKQLATGVVSDYSNRIAQLQQQENALSGQVGKSTALAAPGAGYFVSRVDGYEKAYDIGNILSINASDIRKLETEKASPQSGAVGKIVSEYQWYVVCVLGQDDIRNLKVGDDVGIQFMLSSVDELPAQVVAINGSGSGYAVVLSCGNMSSRLSLVRMQTIRIIRREVTGIKVDNSNIHFVNSNRGVYVLDGNTVRFKKVVPAYSGNGYIISEQDSTDSARLQVYDEVITDGDDLYDGKVFK